MFSVEFVWMSCFVVVCMSFCEEEQLMMVVVVEGHHPRGERLW
jgi:hypothetical protein